jgi:hypothetical protein
VGTIAAVKAAPASAMAMTDLSMTMLLLLNVTGDAPLKKE